MKSNQMNNWRANFTTGLAIILPVVVSLAIVKWLFGTISNITDLLLFWLTYLPIEDQWIYSNGSEKMHFFWSLFALALAIGLITLLGRFARHFIGKKLIQLMDYLMLKVPLLNKIYGAIKQINEALTSNKKSSFKQVLLVEFPKDGVYSVGFLTGDDHGEIQHATRGKVVSVFIPTTPNPTTGFLIMVPEEKVKRLSMSVADGIKLIMSLGSVAPPFVSTADSDEEINERLEAMAMAGKNRADEDSWKSTPLV